MSLQTYFTWLVVATTLTAYGLYIGGIIRGNRPSLATWIIWTIIPMIASTSSVLHAAEEIGLRLAEVTTPELLEFALGLELGVWLTILYVVGGFAILAVTVAKRCPFEFGVIERRASLLAGLGVAMGIVTMVPIIPFIGAILADLAGFWPTMKNARESPVDEDQWGWRLFFISGALALAGSDFSLPFIYWGFAAYVVGPQLWMVWLTGNN